MSKRQNDVEQVIYTNLQCKKLQTFYKNITNHHYTYKIHLRSKRIVYVSIFLRLLKILSCHS